jgi:hypothetical protein
LPRYEDGDNALHIQSVGIPGLSASKSWMPAPPSFHIRSARPAGAAFNALVRALGEFERLPGRASGQSDGHPNAQRTRVR